MAFVVGFPDPTPILPFLEGFSVHKMPNYSSLVATSVSGRELQAAQQAYPLWEFNLTYEVLREQTQNQIPDSNVPYTELQQISQIFLACSGQYGRFFFEDLTDNSRTGQVIGTGDGTTTDFRLARTWGSGSLAFLEPVGGLNYNQTFNVYLNGVLQASTTYIVNNLQVLEFATAPANGVVVSVDFYFWYFCRFLEDINDFEQFYKNLWSLKTLKFRSVKN